MSAGMWVFVCVCEYVCACILIHVCSPQEARYQPQLLLRMTIQHFLFSEIGPFSLTCDSLIGCSEIPRNPSFSTSLEWNYKYVSPCCLLIGVMAIKLGLPCLHSKYLMDWDISLIWLIVGETAIMISIVCCQLFIIKP